MAHICFCLRIKASEYPENAVTLTLVNTGSMVVDASIYFLKPENNSLDTAKETLSASFSVQPTSFHLEAGSKQKLTVFAFPRTPNRFVDSLIVCLQNNPRPLVFTMACDGALPKLNLDTSKLVFEKVLLHR